MYYNYRKKFFNSQRKKRGQAMSTMNLTLLTDLYELTMMQGYFKSHAAETVVFDAFYRKNPNDGGFAIAAGLEQVIDYRRFS